MFKKVLHIYLGVLLLVLTLFLCSSVTSAGVRPTSTSTVTTQKTVLPQIKSRAALLVDPDTNTVLFAKNAYAKNYPASTTKIMTALLTLEKGNLQDVCTISQEDANLPEDYKPWFLQAKERYTVNDLLHALLILSENPAGNTLARYVDGSYPKFAQHMNRRAQELGCQNTHFINPFGKHDPQHYTTCYDLYLMAKAAMQYPTFAKIVATLTYTLPATNVYPRADRLLENSNLLLWSDEPYYDRRCQGIKTGYTTPAGRCIVALGCVGKKKLYVVVLGGSKENGVDQRYADVTKLFNYGFARDILPPPTHLRCLEVGLLTR